MEKEKNGWKQIDNKNRSSKREKKWRALILYNIHLNRKAEHKQKLKIKKVLGISRSNRKLAIEP